MNELGWLAPGQMLIFAGAAVVYGNELQKLHHNPEYMIRTKTDLHIFTLLQTATLLFVRTVMKVIPREPLVEMSR